MMVQLGQWLSNGRYTLDQGFWIIHIALKLVLVVYQQLLELDVLFQIQEPEEGRASEAMGVQGRRLDDKSRVREISASPIVDARGQPTACIVLQFLDATTSSRWGYRDRVRYSHLAEGRC